MKYYKHDLWKGEEIYLKNKSFFLVISVTILVFIPSCNNNTQNLSSISAVPYSSAISIEEKDKHLIQEVLDETDILGHLYEIDRKYIEEMNQNRDICNAARGEIECLYTQQWKEKMTYYYDVLYEVLNKEGKQVLKNSQENWQKTLELEEELNSIIQVQNNIIYDVFGNPEYTAYRARAINLAMKCSSMNVLYDSEGGTLYTNLK